MNDPLIWRVRFARFGIIVVQSVNPEVSLTIITFWRVATIAFIQRNRWIEFALCDGPTARSRKPGSKYHLETKE